MQSAGEEVQDVIGVFTSLDVWWDKALSMYLRDEMVGTGSCLQTLEGGMSQSRFHPELRRYVVDHASCPRLMRPTKPSIPWYSPMCW